MYNASQHSAIKTDNYIYSQLIPYIGNKRKLLDLIKNALDITQQTSGIFVDLFSGSGCVARYAKQLGYKVIANDWEPYSFVLNKCYIETNLYPDFINMEGIKSVYYYLNSLQGKKDYFATYLCPENDNNFDINTERMFFTQKNGQKIDAIRNEIDTLKNNSKINELEYNYILSSMIYSVCYVSNTSGVFKGFHNGWGGQTKTALYRILKDFEISPPILCNNNQQNIVLKEDAQKLAESIQADIVYIDPPYNQHPYGSNYHVLNTLVLYDSPPINKNIQEGRKSAIRTDWRTERQSPYNNKKLALEAYTQLINKLNVQFILTSYSTDGFIQPIDMIQVCSNRGKVNIVCKDYKRYRVSSQRYSEKAKNVEFIIIINTHEISNNLDVDICMNEIYNREQHNNLKQLSLLDVQIERI